MIETERREYLNVTNLTIKDEPEEEDDDVIFVSSRPSDSLLEKHRRRRLITNQPADHTYSAQIDTPRIRGFKVSKVYSLNQSTLSWNRSQFIRTPTTPSLPKEVLQPLSKTKKLLLVKCQKCSLFVPKGDVLTHTSNCLFTASTPLNHKYRDNSISNISKEAKRRIIISAKENVTMIKMMSNISETVETTPQNSRLNQSGAVDQKVPVFIPENNVDNGNKTDPPELIAENSSIDQKQKNLTESSPPEIENMVQNADDKTADDLLLKDSTFSCSLCSFTCRKEKTIKDHERNHRRTNCTIYKCIYCEQRYTKSILYIHMQSIHPGQKLLIGDPVKTDNKNLPADTSDNRTKSNSNNDNNDDIVVPVKAPIKETEEVPLEPVVKTVGLHKCSKCSYVSKKKRAVDKHEVTHQRETNLYKCSNCDFESTLVACRFHEYNCIRNLTADGKEQSDKENIKRKYEMKVDGNNIEPPILSRATADSSNASSAFRNIEKLSSAATAHDNKSSTSLEADDNPRKAKTKCNICQKLIPNIVLQDHIRTHFIENCGTKRNPKFKCKRCSFTSPRYSYLLNHQRSHENNTALVECNNCSFTGTKTALLSHENSCPALIKDKPKLSPQWHCCTQCSYKSTFIRDVQKHEAHHSDTNPIILCTKGCGFRSTKQALYKHMSKCNFKLMFACDNCDFSTNLRVKLNAHMKTDHSSTYNEGPPPLDIDLMVENETNEKKETKNFIKKNEKIVQCSDCSFSTKYPQNLNEHKLSHLKNAELFSCSNLKCDYKATIGAFRKHKRICTKGKKHITLSKDQINSSTNMEKNKNLFQCKLCNFSSELQIKLNMHTKKQHSIKNAELFECTHCSYSARNEHLLKQHLQCHKLKETNNRRDLRPKKEYDRISYEEPKQTSPNKNKVEILCPICSKICTTTNGIVLHLRSHKEISSKIRCEFDKHNIKVLISCIKCNFRTKSYLAIKQHKCLLNYDDDDDDDDDDDELPPVLTPANEEITKKINSVEFQCDRCDYSANLMFKLNQHKRKRHSDEDVDDDNNKPAKKRKLNPELTEHSDNNKKSSKFKCRFCSYTTVTKTHIKSHESNHIDNNRPGFKCPYCPFSALHQPLKVHIKICNRNYSNEMPEDFDMTLVKCTKCSYSTNYPATLIKHENSTCNNTDDNNKESKKSVKELENNSVKSFQCEHCSFTTYLPYLLDRHMHVHNVLKLPISKCPNCNFRGTQLALNTHIDLNCRSK